MITWTITTCDYNLSNNHNTLYTFSWVSSAGVIVSDSRSTVVVFDNCTVQDKGKRMIWAWSTKETDGFGVHDW